jgi:hypothetical protein
LDPAELARSDERGKAGDPHLDWLLASSQSRSSAPAGPFCPAATRVTVMTWGESRLAGV